MSGRARASPGQLVVPVDDVREYSLVLACQLLSAASSATFLDNAIEEPRNQHFLRDLLRRTCRRSATDMKITLASDIPMRPPLLRPPLLLVQEALSCFPRLHVPRVLEQLPGSLLVSRLRSGTLHDRHQLTQAFMLEGNIGRIAHVGRTPFVRAGRASNIHSTRIRRDDSNQRKELVHSDTVHWRETIVTLPEHKDVHTM